MRQLRLHQREANAWQRFSRCAWWKDAVMLLPLRRRDGPHAQVAELVDALVSNTNGAIRTGSIPALGTEGGARLEEREGSISSEKQADLDRRYLAMAQIWAGNSYCTRRQVGALLVRDKMIISDGYNGTPSGFPNVCEDENGVTYAYVLHAEANAITKVAKSNNSSEGATLYVTASPCVECAKLIIQAGIRRVVYGEMYRLNDGVELLRRANIEVLHVDMTNEEGYA